jgi:hypothetical protein
VGCRDHEDDQGLWRPIDDTDAKAIAEYLKKNYGSQ